jgi:hypothetical protein
MPDLAQFPEAIPPGGVRGFVHDPPGALGQPFTVTIPSFSPEHIFQINRWQSRALTVPAVGDECLVIEDEEEEPWVVSWWPTAGDTPIEGGGGEGGNSTDAFFLGG